MRSGISEAENSNLRRSRRTRKIESRLRYNQIIITDTRENSGYIRSYVRRKKTWSSCVSYVTFSLPYRVLYPPQFVILSAYIIYWFYNHAVNILWFYSHGPLYTELSRPHLSGPSHLRKTVIRTYILLVTCFLITSHVYDAMSSDVHGLKMYQSY